MRAVQVRLRVGPPTVLLGVVLLLLGLEATSGLGPAAWVSGCLVAIVTWALVARGMRREHLTALGPANRVTLLRAGISAGVAALVVQSWSTDVPQEMVVALASVALVLDLVDGWLARSRNAMTRLGAAFDMETDAWLILVLSVYAVPRVGPWVLLIGLARYLLLVATLVWPWLTRPTPPRRWAKVVAAVQGVVLVVVASDVLPRRVAEAAAACALALLVESFARQVGYLWRHRREETVARPRALRPVVDALAVVLLWAILLLPHRPDRLSGATWLAIPVELLVFVALAVVLPTVWGRALAVAGGLLLAGTAVLAVLDLGTYEAFDRPFDVLNDPGYTASGLDYLDHAVGREGRTVVIALLVALVTVAGVGCVWAGLRVRRAAHASPQAWMRAATGLLVVWTVAVVGGARVDGVPVAAAPAADVVRTQVDQVEAELQDRAAFDRAITHDAYASTPGSHLLTALRGKDVLVVFVESYGRVAVDGSWFAPRDDRTLARATTRLDGLGFDARSGWLQSPTFGGLSWLAHSTLQTGLWIDNQRRYDSVLSGSRLTLTSAFGQAGWRTVSDIPSDVGGWPEGRRFYGFDRMYNGSDVGYGGPRFSYARVPDQFTFRAFTRNELRGQHRRPVMAEIDLVSSHSPWASIPRIVPWRNLEGGIVYDSMPTSDGSIFDIVGGSTLRQASYARSIRYSLRSLVSFVRHAHDRKLVMVVLGDHQPNTLVSGINASHDVPVSLVAHDPRVLARIDGWGWTNGLRPASDVPALRMDRFRDRFLAAFGSTPATP